MQYPIDFFSSLDIGDQLILLELTLQGLRDEIADNFADLDVNEEHLEKLYQKLGDFMEGLDG